MTLSRLLVADDGSEGAAAARAWAVALAEATSAEVLIAGVAERTVDVSGSSVTELTGPPVPALLAFADDVAADLLVAGRRGTGGFEGLVLGSTVHQLAERSRRPVAVVPASADLTGHGWPVTAITVGHDGSPGGARALSWVVALGELRATVQVVHASELAPAYAAAGLAGAYVEAQSRLGAAVEEWCAPLREAGIDYTTVVEEGGPAGVLLEAVRKNGTDLLVVGRKPSGSFPGMAMGSAAHRVLGFAPCPTVIVPTSD